MVAASLLISILSLIVAGASLYFSQLRKAKIGALVGPEILIYHHDYEHGVSTGFIVPVSFLNNSPSTGTILKAAICIYKHGCEDERYFIQWLKFDVLDESTFTWRHEEDCHALVIGPRSGLHKNICFMWFPQNEKKLFLENGRYTISVFAWINQLAKPTEFKRNFYITKEHQEVFQKLRENQQAQSLKITLDKDIENNRLMTNNEATKLLL
jgi:hypothetical protein